MRSKKSARSTESQGAETKGRKAKSKVWSAIGTGWNGNMGPWTMSVVVCFVVAAVLIAARQPSQPTDVRTAAIKIEKVQPAAELTKATVARTQSSAAAAKAPAPQPAKAAAAEMSASKAVASKDAAQESISTTITGCLEQNAQTFRLKDTTGEDTPKARSWKSGFLRKGSASINLVDPANRLSSHTGKRVSVTGMLTDREMRVSSIRRVAASCD